MVLDSSQAASSSHVVNTVCLSNCWANTTLNHKGEEKGNTLINEPSTPWDLSVIHACIGYFGVTVSLHILALQASHQGYNPTQLVKLLSAIAGESMYQKGFAATD